MTTMEALVRQTRRRVWGAMSDNLNFLAAEYEEGGATLQFTMPIDGITPGIVISSGLNTWYVIATNKEAKTAQVYAGYEGSQNAALPEGSPVMIRPRASDWYVFEALQNVITSLSSPATGLYREGSWEANANTIWGTYEIPTDVPITDLSGVQFQWPTSTNVWVDVPATSWRYQPERGVVRLTESMPAGVILKFDYKGPFTPPTALTDDPEVDCGLAATMLDLPPLGAAIQLALGGEGRRVQPHVQGDTRKPGETPAGASANMARELERAYTRRVGEEHFRLLARNPYRQER